MVSVTAVNRRVSNILVALAAVVITYRCARAADLVVLRVVRPPRGEVLLISDVILATAFGVMVYLWLHLRATRMRLTDLERTQVAMDTQLSLAAQIQRHLLPPIPAGSNGVRWAGRLEPAYRIGGDFYDFIPAAAASPPPQATGVVASVRPHAGNADGLFVIGDVSGKGIPAALLQASAHSLFRTLARDTVDPAELLTRVSREIYAENAGALYLTCILIRVDSASRRLVYTNAGHPAGLIMGSAGCRLLSRGGPPAGLFPETSYEAAIMSVAPGDLGVFVSDGITEAVEEDGVPAAAILNRAVCNIPLPRTPERVCDALIEMAQRHSGPRGVADWEDDKTVLAFLFDGDEVQTRGDDV